MIQGDKGNYSGFQQAVHQSVVIGKSLLIDLIDSSFGQNSRPAHGKPIGLQPEGFDQLKVLFQPMISVCGNVSGFPVLDGALLTAERIPDT
jgi:hypothetical protein